jgi:hypothetical protein
MMNSVGLGAAAAALLMNIWPAAFFMRAEAS